MHRDAEREDLDLAGWDYPDYRSGLLPEDHLTTVLAGEHRIAQGRYLLDHSTDQMRHSEEEYVRLHGGDEWPVGS